MFDVNQPPPQDAFDRCTRFEQFYAPRRQPNSKRVASLTAYPAENAAGRIRRRFPHCRHGICHRLCRAAGTSDDRAQIARWSDRYRPPPGEKNERLGGYPYLSDHFQFTEKVPGAAPYLKNIFCYTYAATASLASTAGISQLKFGADRISFGITRELFVDDAEAYFADLCAYCAPELDTSVHDAGRPQPAARSRLVSR